MLALKIISAILLYFIAHLTIKFILRSENLLFFTLLHPIIIYIGLTIDIFNNKITINEFNLVAYICLYLILSIILTLFFDLYNLKYKLINSLKYKNYLESNNLMIIGIILMIVKFFYFNYGFGSKYNSGIFNYILLLWNFNYGILFITFIRANRFKIIIYLILFSIEFILSSSKGVILNLLILFLLSEIITKGSLYKSLKPIHIVISFVIIFSIFSYSWAYRYIMPTFDQTVNVKTIIELNKKSSNDVVDFAIIMEYMIDRNEVFKNFQYQVNQKSNYTNRDYPNTILSLLNIIPNNWYHALFGSSKVYFSYFTAKNLLDFHDGSSASSGKLGEAYYNYGVFFPIQLLINYTFITLLLLLCVTYRYPTTLTLLFLFIIIRDDSIFETSFTIFWIACIEFIMKKRLKYT